MKRTIINKIAEHAEVSPYKAAIIDRTIMITYSELWDGIRRVACGLNDLYGVGKGDNVIIRASQTALYAVTFLGIIAAGAVAVSLEKNVPLETVTRIAHETKCKLIISNRLNNPEYAQETVEYMNDENLTELVYYKTIQESYIFPDDDSVALIMFTTGTTGDSKGVVIQHKSLYATADIVSTGVHYSSDTMLVVPGPMNHGNATRKLVSSMFKGSAVYIVNGMLSVKDFFTALNSNYGRVACCLPPSAIKVLLNLAQDELKKYENFIDFIETGTAPLSEADRERLRTCLPKTRLIMEYGSTEATTFCMYDFNKHPGKPNCVGKPSPYCRVFIVNENREPIESSPENTGFIACASEGRMLGYFNDPVKTREVLQEGIIYTNDIGYIDNEGNVYVLGRQGDVINVGGLKVIPLEVEDKVMEIKGISDCICVSAPNDICGHVPKLYVKMEKNANISDQTIINHLVKRLEGYKIPRIIEHTDEIKRTFNGKLDRKAYSLGEMSNGKNLVNEIS